MTFIPRGDDLWGLGDYDDPDLRLNGLDDATGVRWAMAKPVNWDRTSVSAPIIEGGGDGGYFTPGRRLPKVLTVTGAFVACSRAALDTAEDQLRAALERWSGVPQLLWRDRAGRPPVQMGVQLTGELDVDEVRGNPRGRVFSAVLTAADPLKYAAGAAGLITEPFMLPQDTANAGLIFPVEFPVDFGGATSTETGRRTIINPGTQPILPLVTYTGPVPGPQLRNLTIPAAEGVTTTLLDGQTLVVNHETGLITSDTRSLFSQRIIGNTFWPVLPGANDVVFTADAFNTLARAVLTYRPAWS